MMVIATTQQPEHTMSNEALMNLDNVDQIATCVVDAIKAGKIAIMADAPASKIVADLLCAGYALGSDITLIEVRRAVHEAGLVLTSMSEGEAMRDLEECFALVLKAASFDELVSMLHEFGDMLDGLGFTDVHSKTDIMGKLDLPGLPTWGAGGDLHGAWSWDATRVLYLDAKFCPSVEMRTDLDDDASEAS